MNKRTTADWEALLDGATPAPWCVGGKDADGNTYVGNYDPDIGGPAASTGSDDAPLVAAAPEAVAEVVRLRRAFTHWAEGLDTLADEMREEGHIMNSEQVKAITAGIRRILEGDSDE